MEEPVGAHLRVDIVAVIDNNRELIDVGITAPRIPKPNHTWPTDQQVSDAVELEEQNGVEQPLFFWEDHGSEVPHSESVRIRKYRELAFAGTVGKDMGNMERIKEHHYAQNGELVTPFILSAGGGVSKPAKRVLREAVKRSYIKVGERSAFSRRWKGRLSLLLVRHSHRMAAWRARKALARWDPVEQRGGGQ